MSLPVTTAVPASISAVVPVRDHAAVLDRCLRALVPASGAPAAIREVVVVDAGSADDSADVAAARGARVVRAGPLPPGAARNRGAALARGDVLLFVDADVELTGEGLGAVRRLASDPGIEVAGGIVRPPCPASPVAAAYDLLRNRPAHRVGARWLDSGLLLIRREVFEAAGGFDESLFTCEDVELSSRLRAAGRRLVLDPDLGAVHHGDPRSFGDVVRGELWRGRDNLRVTARARRPDELVSGLASGAVAAALLGLTHRRTRSAGLAIVAGSVALRAVRMAARRPSGGGPGSPTIVAVAAGYEVARALALLWPASYHRRRGRGEAR